MTDAERLARLLEGIRGDLGSKGAGIVHIRAVSPNDREFELTGEVVVSKK